MSLYSCVVNSTCFGQAGTSKVLIVGFFPHIHEAKIAITELIDETYMAPDHIEIKFLSHSNTIFVSDIQNYERILVIE